jgi:nucleoside-diphosphate-sugar epimerase
LTEDHPERPVSFYGESKLAGERELLRHQGRFAISIARPPIVYGPRDRRVFGLIHAVSRNLLPVVRGATRDGEKYYSLIHVRDLCRGLVQSALAPPGRLAPAEVFYLAGDGIQTYGETTAAIADVLGCEPLRVRIPRVALRAAAAALSGASLITRKTFPLNLDKLNEILPDYWICSNRKAKDLLGFRAEYDLRSGMADTIAWYKKQNWL